MNCSECAEGSEPVFVGGWGWVHADEGAPSPLPCANSEVEEYAANESVCYIHLFVDACNECCTAQTAGDLCGRCEVVREKIARIMRDTANRSIKA